MILLALLALLAFLFPLTVYVLFLSMVNRRPTPVVISGSWDAVGLILASCGFLLAGGPAILTALYYKDLIPGDEPAPSFEDLWLKWWLLWVIYYLLIAAGTVLVMWMRRPKTIIYNVDADLFESSFAQLAASHGYRAVQHAGRWLIGPSLALEVGASDAIQDLDGENRIAALPLALPSAPPISLATVQGEVLLDAFAPMCHVTLHWHNTTPQFQIEFETALRRHIAIARAFDNPAGNWFLVLAGLLFGVLTLLAVLAVLAALPPRHW